MKLEQRHVLVIGAAGGIGRQIAGELIRRGTPVTGVDINPSASSDQSYQHIEVDFSRESAVDKVLQSLERPPTHVISVAGGALKAEVRSTTPWVDGLRLMKPTIDANLGTSLNAIRAILPFGTTSGDRAVILCSSINSTGSYGYLSYSASKGAVESTVRSATHPLGRLGIRINAVRLGTVLTPQAENLHGPVEGEHFTALMRGSALGRFVTMTEAAQACVGLALDLTAVTGIVLTVDCGQTVPHAHD